MKYLLPACLVLILATPAFADEEETARWRQRAPVYNAYDLDEYDNARIIDAGPLDFSAADDDKDGTVSRTEMRRYLRDYERDARDNHSRRDARIATDNMALQYQRADRNGDGDLSAGEYRNFEAGRASGNGRPSFYYRSGDRD